MFRQISCASSVYKEEVEEEEDQQRWGGDDRKNAASISTTEQYNTNCSHNNYNVVTAAKLSTESQQKYYGEWIQGIRKVMRLFPLEELTENVVLLSPL